jgi:hypothetical protein
LDICEQPLTGEWPAPSAARAKLPHSTSWSLLQAATSPPTLSWSANVPFNCYMCSASFKYSSDLSRHQVSHSPVKDPKSSSGDASYNLAQEIPQHGGRQSVPITREQAILPIVSRSSFTIPEAENKVRTEALRNKVGNAHRSVPSDEEQAGREDSHEYPKRDLQLMSRTIKKGASALPNAKSSPPLSMEVDIASSVSDEETDWGSDSEESFAEYSTSYFRFVDDPTEKANDKDSFVELALSPAKQAVADRLMKEFWALFNAKTRAAT